MHWHPNLNRVNAGKLILKFLASLVLSTFKFTRLASNETMKMRVMETLRKDGE